MRKLRILHLDDSAADALLVRETLAQAGLNAEVVHAATAASYLDEIKRGGLDAILADSGLPGFSGEAALQLAREVCPQTPYLVVSNALDKIQPDRGRPLGVSACIPKSQIWRLVPALQGLEAREETPPAELERQNLAMKRLVEAVQELSLARDLDTIMAIVRKAARELTGADGATFVLRDGDNCHYAEENAISPLWKGQKFPMSACISGWVMLQRQPAVIGDIYQDARIPAAAYRPTFVKSLAMVPIRTQAPIGAIGNYWARSHFASGWEVEILQALANTTSVAMENVQVYGELEQRVADRTRQLQAANRELKTFSYSVSHDLRNPLNIIGGFAGLLEQTQKGVLGPKALGYLDSIIAETHRMSELIEDLLRLAKFSEIELRRENVDLSRLAGDVAARLQSTSRTLAFTAQPGLTASADAGMVRIVLENLLANAWKYSARQPQAAVAFGQELQPDGTPAFFVRDNGAGFDMQHAQKLFAPFQRLHSDQEFAGTGVGLATVQRIIHRHGGRIWAEAAKGRGATFYFTLPNDPVPGL